MPDRRVPKSTQTGSASPMVRRMDSLARLMHVRGSFVTAVGYDANSRNMLVAANQHPAGHEGYFEEVGRRVGVIQNFTAGEMHLHDAVAALRNQDYSDRRLGRDLKKLSRSLRGGYDPSSGRNFPKEMASDFMERSWLAHRGGDDVHAELDVARRAQQGAIGVSRLNCLDCHEHIQENFNGQIETRGTHGFAFRGWKNPGTRRNAWNTSSKGRMPDHHQFPDDSDSDSDG